MAKKVILSKKQKELLANRGYWERIHKEEYLETDRSLEEVASFVNLNVGKIKRIFKFLDLRSKTKKESVKSSYASRKKTNLERYGVENISQSKAIKEKKKQTCIENYGV